MRYLFAVVICLSVFTEGLRPSYAASTPVTSDFSLLPFDDRNTCDPEFWDVLKDRAWMEAQREITQNANIIPRPDSVLSVSCFHSYMQHQARYQHRNFPEEPDESEGQLAGGVFMRLATIISRFEIWGWNDTSSAGILFPGYEGDYEVSGDPYVTHGFYSNGLIELLILDQLVQDVSAAGLLADIVSTPLGLVCSGKYGYIEDNFPDLLIGDRAKFENPAGTVLDWAPISAGMNDSISNSSSYNGCAAMGEMWRRAQCYDFATESSLDISPPAGATTNAIGLTSALYEHDAFYTLEEYRNRATDVGEDFRTLSDQCDIPNDDGIPSMSGSDMLCQYALHGPIPYSFGGSCPPVSSGGSGGAGGSFDPSNIVSSILGNLCAFSSFLPWPTEDNPTWETAFDGAYPDSNAPGAVDEYVHYRELSSGTFVPVCAPPIKIGYVVKAINGTDQYIDAVCPTPGCFFNPPTTIGGNGTCAQ